MVRFLGLTFTYSFNAIVCYTKCACAWFNMSVIQNVTTGTIDLQCRRNILCNTADQYLIHFFVFSTISLFCVTILILFCRSILLL